MQICLFYLFIFFMYVYFSLTPTTGLPGEPSGEPRGRECGWQGPDLEVLPHPRPPALKGWHPQPGKLERGDSLWPSGSSGDSQSGSFLPKRKRNSARSHSWEEPGGTWDSPVRPWAGAGLGSQVSKWQGGFGPRAAVLASVPPEKGVGLAADPGPGRVDTAAGASPAHR